MQENLNFKDYLTPKEIGKYIRKRLKNKWDYVIVVSGEEGSGKSTLGIEVGGSIDYSFRNLIRVSKYYKALMRNVMFAPTREEIEDKVKNLPPFSAIIDDEGMKTKYKGNWMKATQKKLNIFFSLNRKEYKANIICIPNFVDLAKYWRGHRVKAWLYIIKRGIAAFMVPKQNPFSSDPWDIIQNEKKIDKLTNKGVALSSAVRKINICKGIVRFPRLPESFEKVYEPLANKYKYETPKEEKVEKISALAKRYQKGFDIMNWYANKHLKLPQSKIASLHGGIFSQQAISNSLTRIQPQDISLINNIIGKMRKKNET